MIIFIIAILLFTLSIIGVVCSICYEESVDPVFIIILWFSIILFSIFLLYVSNLEHKLELYKQSSTIRAVILNEIKEK